MTQNIAALQTQFTADISKIEASMKKLDKLIDSQMAKVEKRGEEAGSKFGEGFSKFLGHSNPGEAIENIFSKSRLAIFEEGAAKIPIFGSALEALGPIGIAVGAAMAGVAISLEQARKAMEWADEIDRFSKTVGTSTDNLQAFDDANTVMSVGLKEGRANLEDFSGIFAKFQAHLGDKKSVKWFDAMGLSRASVAGVTDSITALEIVLKRVAGMGNQSNRIGALNALGLGQFKEVVADGEEGVKKYMEAIKDAQANGGIVSEEDIAKAAELNDHVELMQHRIGQELKKAFIDLAPTVDSVATFLEHVAHAISDIVGQIPAAISGFADLAKQLVKVTGLQQSAQWWSGQFGPDSPMAQVGRSNDAAYSKRVNDGHHPIAAGIDYALNRDFGGMLSDGWNALVQHERAVDPSTAPAKPAEKPTNRIPAPATQFGTDKTGGGANRAEEIIKASLAAIASAMKDELSARLAISHDLDEQHEIRSEMLDQERQAKDDQISEQVKLGKITKAAGAKAKSLNDQSFAEKAQAEEQKYAEDKAAASAEYGNKLRALQAADLSARADLADTAEKWAANTKTAFDLSQVTETSDFIQEVNEARKKGLSAENEAAWSKSFFAKQSADAAKQDADIDKEVRSRKAAFASDLSNYLTDTLQFEMQMAKTAAERNAIEDHILAERQKQERDQLANRAKDEHWSSDKTASETAALNGKQTAERGAMADSHKNPFQVYLDGLKDLDTQIQNMKVDAFKSLEDGFAGMIAGTTSAADAFKSMATSIIADIARIIVEKSLLSLFDAGTGGGGFLANLFGGHALGTNSSAGGWKLVGENGPELMRIPQGAQVMNNAGLRGLEGASGGGAGSTIWNLHTHVYADNSVLRDTIRQEIYYAHTQAISTARSQAAADAQRKRDRSFRR